ncbi:MAG TPA: hypothetical protein VNY84_10705, partial [Acidimicrobiales bacterium]|nr:hypothetical protein [Acidimicrobiales bacterium]
PVWLGRGATGGGGGATRCTVGRATGAVAFRVTVVWGGVAGTAAASAATSAAGAGDAAAGGAAAGTAATSNASGWSKDRSVAERLARLAVGRPAERLALAYTLVLAPPCVPPKASRGTSAIPKHSRKGAQRRLIDTRLLRTLAFYSGL